jgi:hypothetical protein
VSEENTAMVAALGNNIIFKAGFHCFESFCGKTLGLQVIEIVSENDRVRKRVKVSERKSENREIGYLVSIDISKGLYGFSENVGSAINVNLN